VLGIGPQSTYWQAHESVRCNSAIYYSADPKGRAANEKVSTSN
jgi:hypothetical protein